VGDRAGADRTWSSSSGHELREWPIRSRGRANGGGGRAGGADCFYPSARRVSSRAAACGRAVLPSIIHVRGGSGRGRCSGSGKGAAEARASRWCFTVERHVRPLTAVMIWLGASGVRGGVRLICGRGASCHNAARVTATRPAARGASGGASSVCDGTQVAGLRPVMEASMNGADRRLAWCTSLTGGGAAIWLPEGTPRDGRGHAAGALAPSFNAGLNGRRRGCSCRTPGPQRWSRSWSTRAVFGGRRIPDEGLAGQLHPTNRVVLLSACVHLRPWGGPCTWWARRWHRETLALRTYELGGGRRVRHTGSSLLGRGRSRSRARWGAGSALAAALGREAGGGASGERGGWTLGSLSHGRGPDWARLAPQMRGLGGSAGLRRGVTRALMRLSNPSTGSTWPVDCGVGRCGRAW